MPADTALRPASVGELSQIVRDAHSAGQALRIVGRGTWLFAGRPVRPGAQPVETTALTGIVEYVPGDLTLTARAGTTLAEIDSATAPNRQWCPLAPFGGDQVTLGAVLATATAGPFAAAMGRPRDLALGLQFVDGTGAIARGGGRVVKNVAGFDLTRLLIGSWGTLGIITEVSLRLRALPRIDETWVLTADWEEPAVSRALDALMRGPLAPLGLARLEPHDSERIGLRRERAVLVRIGGNASLAGAMRRALRAIGQAAAGEASLWTRYRAMFTGFGHYSLSPNPWTPLGRRLRARFDPKGILNPGILGDEETSEP